MLPTWQQLYTSWTAIKGSEDTLIDALDLMEPIEINQNYNKIKSINFNHKINIVNVSFSYDQNKFILDKINLSINKGQKIGIIGKTGCGKSTLIDIMMGLLTPNNGELYVDGVRVSFSSEAWQSKIAHVPQIIFLADASINENIAFGIPPNLIDYEKVVAAAKIAQLTETIDALPRKFNTKVGERGIQLSGGQRQRIGIARAIYKSADIIFLDEATSALDSDTEQLIINEINKLDSKCTILIIAHRTDTLKSCDLILELSNSKIIRIGTYPEIILGKN
jgi:ATP-binding cassette subfamily B protein